MRGGMQPLPIGNSSSVRCDGQTPRRRPPPLSDKPEVRPERCVLPRRPSAAIACLQTQRLGSFCKIKLFCNSRLYFLVLQRQVPSVALHVRA